MELKHCTSFNLQTSSKVLIVPYGIETRFAKTLPGDHGVLIVPYGIETSNVISETSM